MSKLYLKRVENEEMKAADVNSPSHFGNEDKEDETLA